MKLCHIRNTKHQLFLGKKKLKIHGGQWIRTSGAFRAEIFEFDYQGFSANEISSHSKLIMQEVNRIVLHYRRYGTALSSITSRQSRCNSAHPLMHGGLWNFFILRNTGKVLFNNPVNIWVLIRGSILLMYWLFISRMDRWITDGGNQTKESVVFTLLGPGQSSILTRYEHISNAKWAQTIAGILPISICIYEYIIPSRASGAATLL